MTSNAIIGLYTERSRLRNAHDLMPISHLFIFDSAKTSERITMAATNTESSILKVRRPTTFIATFVHTARIIDARRIHVTMLRTGL